VRLRRLAKGEAKEKKRLAEQASERGAGGKRPTPPARLHR